jgi:hypothetical protein
LRGDEIRACWEASTVPIEVAPTPGERRTTAPLHVVEDRTPVRKLEFVEVGPAPAAPRRRAVKTGVGPQAAESTGEPIEVTESLVAASPAEPRWSFWSDAEV